MSAARPWRQLLPLAAAVVAVHLALLWQTPVLAPWRSNVRASLQGLVVRQIPAVAPKSDAAPAPVSVARPVVTPMPVPRPVIAEATRAAPQASPVAPATPPPTPAATTAALPQAVAIAPPRRLRYEVSAHLRGTPRQGRAELSWQHDGERYEARFEQGGGALPARVQRSSGRLTPQGLAPQRFTDRRRAEQATHFERDREALLFSANRPEAPLLPGAQDRLSVLLQLGALIAGQPTAYPPSTTVLLQTATARDADVWHFRIEAEEELLLAGHRVPTLRVLRLPQQDWELKLELWLAPSLDYAPARLRLTQAHGDWTEYRWSGTDRD